MPKGQKSQLVTKKHLARQERERLQNRYILITSIAIVVIVLGLIGFGIAQQYLIQPRQPVAKVGNDAITTKQFQTYARYARMQLISQYQQYQQFAQMFGSDQNSLSYIQQYLAQINYQLQPLMVGQSALDYLIANQLIQNEADKRGITVTDSEVNSELEANFGYYPNGTPTSAATSVAVPTSTLNPTQLALVPPTATASPTATYTPTQVLTTTQLATSPTPTTVITPTAQATTGASATGTPAPSPTPYTESEYQKNLKTTLDNLNTSAGITEQDLRWIIKMQLLRQKVYEAITADITRQQDEVWARHISAKDETEAKSVYDRLSTGESFDKVASEVYSGTANTTDLGWFTQGTLDAKAEPIVWKLKIGQISEPIQTANGWEVYQVLGHEVRTLNDTDFDNLKQKKFQEWLDTQKAAENVQTFDVWKTRVPTSPTIPPTQPSQ